MADLKFTFFCRRWGHEDFYRILSTVDGWHVSHLSYAGKCNKRGEPVLYRAMRHIR